MVESSSLERIKEAEEEISQSIINKYLLEDNEDVSKIEVIHNDEMLENDKKYIASNNESFKKLLQNYTENTKCTLIAKLFFKIVFFVVCIYILIRVSNLLIYITNYCLVNEIGKENLLAVMIEAIISFLASFIVLPKTIASYLFDTEEEKYMTDLVKNIQEHDKSIREDIHKS